MSSPAAATPRRPSDIFNDPDIDLMVAVSRQVSARSEYESLQVGRVNAIPPVLEKSAQIPLWMRWKEFWAVLAVILAIVGVSVYNLTSSDARLLGHLQKSVVYVAQTHAADITRQIRTSVSSLQALEAIVAVDKYGTSLQDFDKLAESLIRTYKGISNLQLAPFGTIQVIYPLVDETQDNRAALGHALLLDPARKDGALKTVLARTTQVVGPLKLLQGGVAAIARRPIFSRHAPKYLPDEWFVASDGVNYTRTCSLPEFRDRAESGCSFQGPPDLDGETTYFWGFATLLMRMDDLLNVTDLASLETGAREAVPGIAAFAFQLEDLKPHPSVVDFGGVWLRSARTEALHKAVEAMVAVEEFGFQWRLLLVPVDGWPAVSEHFWLQLLLILPTTAFLGAALGVGILLGLRRHALKLEDLAKYLEKKRVETIRSSVENLNHFQFPMYLVECQNFLRMGRLVQHEEARETGKLRCFDFPEDISRVLASEEVVFISHQWVGFRHPDPENVQYQAMHIAIDGFRKKGIECGLIWVDYTSIPQANAFLQQSAINSLSVYASNCSVFLTVAPKCTHADTGRPLDMHTYRSRAWCRLELLSYKCRRGAEEEATYACDGKTLMDADWDEEATLQVLDGYFSCCSRQHPEGQQCDCEKIRAVLLGLCWRLMAIRRDGEGRPQAWATRMMERLAEDREKYFPSYFSYASVEGLQRRELFQGYFPLLQSMFEEDSALNEAERLQVSAILGSCIPSETHHRPLGAQGPKHGTTAV